MLVPQHNKQKIMNGIVVVLLLSMLMSWSTNNPQRLEFFQNVAGEALYPFQYAASAVTGFFVVSWEFIVDVRKVYTENQRLKELVDEYTGIEYQLIETRLTNQRLQALLNFRQEMEFDVTPAQVIGRNPSTWFSNLTIDKGSKHGIKVDMPVVTNQGLVGKIIEVYPSYSKVQLLISPDSGVSSIVQRTRDNGVLIGLSHPSGYLRITRLSALSDVKEGDVIISSPLTGLYPKGLVIGRVVEVYYNPVTLERSALVKPEVDFDRLEEVLIITDYTRVDEQPVEQEEEQDGEDQ